MPPNSKPQNLKFPKTSWHKKARFLHQYRIGQNYDPNKRASIETRSSLVPGGCIPRGGTRERFPSRSGHSLTSSMLHHLPTDARDCGRQPAGPILYSYRTKVHLVQRNGRFLSTCGALLGAWSSVGLCGNGQGAGRTN